MNNQDPNETIEEIRELIDWYFDNVTKQPTPEKLIAIQDKLSIYSYYLAEICGQAKGDYNKKYFCKKIEVAISKQGLIKNKGMKVNQAEIDAEINNRELIEESIEAETTAYTCDLLLRQVNKILSATSQRISYLKQEKQNSRTQV